MPSRYAGAPEFINSSQVYREIFEDRGVSQIKQYGTRNLIYPTKRQIDQLDVVAHRWVYGDSSMWWVIAFFNQTPTESHLRFGSVVYVPHPIERVLGFYGV